MDVTRIPPRIRPRPAARLDAAQSSKTAVTPASGSRASATNPHIAPADNFGPERGKTAGAQKAAEGSAIPAGSYVRQQMLRFGSMDRTGETRTEAVQHLDPSVGGPRSYATQPVEMETRNSPSGYHGSLWAEDVPPGAKRAPDDFGSIWAQAAIDAGDDGDIRALFKTDLITADYKQRAQMVAILLDGVTAGDDEATILDIFRNANADEVGKTISRLSEDGHLTWLLNDVDNNNHNTLRSLLVSSVKDASHTVSLRAGIHLALALRGCESAETTGTRDALRDLLEHHAIRFGPLAFRSLRFTAEDPYLEDAVQFALVVAERCR